MHFFFSFSLPLNWPESMSATLATQWYMEDFEPDSLVFPLIATPLSEFVQSDILAALESNLYSPLPFLSHAPVRFQKVYFPLEW